MSLRTTILLSCVIALSSSAATACNIASRADGKDKDEKSKTKASDDDDDDAPKKKKKKKDADKSDDAADKKKEASRLSQLFGVESASTDVVPILMDIKGVQLSRPKSWRSEPAADFASADNSSFPKEQRARCHLVSRIQPGDVMGGVKLWSRSAGGAPASWSGPETLEVGPDKIVVDLYWGKDGVKVGAVGQSVAGVTVALHPKEFPELLLIGIAREDAPVEMKRELVACLESFSKKK